MADLASTNEVEDGEDSWRDQDFCLPLCEAVYDASTSQPTNTQAETISLPLFHCGICTKPFWEKTKFISHVQDHSGETDSGENSVESEEDDDADDTQEDEGMDKMAVDNSYIHIEDISSISNYKCAICFQAFPTDKSLVVHVLTHDIEKSDTNSTASPIVPTDSSSALFTCAICSKRCATETELCAHVLRHQTYIKRDTETTTDRVVNEIPNFTCAICGQMFDTELTLVVHVSQHSEVKNKTLNNVRHFPQQDVDKDTSTASSGGAGLKRKIRFVCAVCNETCETGEELVKHVNNGCNASSVDSASIAPLNNGLYTCAICNITLESDVALARHVKGHSSACDIQVTVINQETSKSSQLRSCRPKRSCLGSQTSQDDPETNKVDVDVLSFRCAICNEYFKNKTSLKSHVETHLEQKTKTKSREKVSRVRNTGAYSCALCAKVYPNEAALIVHVNNHALAKTHVCPVCQKEFKCHSHMKRHEKIHSGIRDYHCSICPASFSRQSHLTTHKRIHDGIKPYKCTAPGCKKSFTDGSNLKKHATNKHTNEKNYKCQTCGKVFGRSDTLKKHNRSHSGEKPYFCDICARYFPRRDSLMRHQMSHRGERPNRCVICDRRFTQKYDLTLHYRTHARNFTLPSDWSMDLLGLGRAGGENLDLVATSDTQQHTIDGQFTAT